MFATKFDFLQIFGNILKFLVCKILLNTFAISKKNFLEACNNSFLLHKILCNNYHSKVILSTNFFVTYKNLFPNYSQVIFVKYLFRDWSAKFNLF